MLLQVVGEHPHRARRIADVEVKVVRERALAEARAAENKRVQAQMEAEQAAQRKQLMAQTAEQRKKREQEDLELADEIAKEEEEDSVGERIVRTLLVCRQGRHWRGRRGRRRRLAARGP